ncbi:MAG: tetratricopeptide repeat protein [Planctomycetes bacterium]|nr:tetratricopeptide repeat protein [Planctomycetota bacterium]
MQRIGAGRMGGFWGGVCFGVVALVGCEKSPTPASGPAVSESRTPAPQAAPAAGSPAADAPTATAPAGAVTSRPVKQIELPAFDTAKLPQPVRTKYGELKRRVEAGPGSYNEALTIAALHYVHGDAGDAVKIIAQVTQDDQRSVPTLHMLGLCCEKAKQPDGAIKAYEQAIAADPTFVHAYVRIGVLSFDKDAAKAQAAFAKAVELSPDDPRPHLGVAKALKAMGKKEEALKKCEDALALFPQYAEAHRDAAELCEALGRKADAEKHKQMAEVGQLPNNPDPIQTQLLVFGLDLRSNIQTALSLAQQGDIVSAEQILLSCILLDTTGTAARRAMASVKTTAGKLDEASSILLSVLESDPKEAAALMQLGDVYDRQGKQEEALEQLQKALTVAPEAARDPRLNYMIGMCQFRLDKLDDAQKSWEKVIEVAPLFEEAYTAMAQIAAKKKDAAEFIRILQTGLKNAPQSQVLMNGLAWIYATSEDAKFRNAAEAVKLAEQAVHLSQNRVHQFLDTLACAYAEAGRFEDASRRIDEAIKLATQGKATAFVDQYKGRVKLFAEKKPYREPLGQ